MNPRIRFLVSLTIAITVGATTFATLDAHAAPVCRYQRLEPGHWTRLETKRTVACFADVMRVSKPTALAVSYRESRWFARAWNRSGCGGSGCINAFQHHAGYWPGRVAAAKDALRRFEVKKRDWRNPRVAAVVTFVHVRRYGWGAWSA